MGIKRMRRMKQRIRETLREQDRIRKRNRDGEGSEKMQRSEGFKSDNEIKLGGEKSAG